MGTSGTIAIRPRRTATSAPPRSTESLARRPSSRRSAPRRGSPGSAGPRWVLSPSARKCRVRIRSTSGSPQGAKLHYIDGNPAHATYTWTPSKSQIGVYHVTFTATSDLSVGSATRTLVIRVGPPNKPPPGPGAPAGVYPNRYTLSDRSTETYRWAFVRHRTVARTGPSSSARAIAPITFRTPELYRNAILVLDAVKYRNGKTWVRIRLSVLPNNTTGWVPRGALTGFQRIHTRMVIRLSDLRATLYKRGRPVFSARVGVGQSGRPPRAASSTSGEALRLLRAGVRSARARAEREVDHADGLARRRLRRHPRDERAADSSGTRLARLCADAEPGHPQAVPHDAARDPGQHSVARSVAEATAKAERAARGTWAQRFAGRGFVAQGVTYGLVAALAIEVAIGKRGNVEDRTGALQSLADKPGGRFLLGAIAVGLGGYAFWKFTQAALGEARERKGCGRPKTHRLCGRPGSSTPRSAWCVSRSSSTRTSRRPAAAAAAVKRSIARRGSRSSSLSGATS